MTELAVCCATLESKTRHTRNWLQGRARRRRNNSGNLLILLLLGAVSVFSPNNAVAQKKGDRVRVLAGSAMRTAPGGQVVGVLSRVFEGPVELVQGSAVRLRLNGFVSEQSVRLDANRARGLIGGSENNGGILRTGPSEKEPALATLQRGAVVFSGQKSSSFLSVNRVVWVDKSRLAKFTTPGATANRPPVAGPSKPVITPVASSARSGQATASPAATSPVAGPANPVNGGLSSQSRLPAAALPPMQTVGSSSFRSAPNGDVISTLSAGTLVNPLAAENGWTRVRVDGWIATKDLTDATAKAAGELSAADLRADPVGTKGRVVRWTVEALSYQLGDALRRELNGEPYLLVRGPGNERAILYLAVPDSLIAQARALAPLTSVVVSARVRTGRSEPGGVPILDLLELTRR